MQASSCRFAGISVFAMFFLLRSAFLPAQTAAHTPPHPAESATVRMDLGMTALMSHYNVKSGLWRGEGWWNAANSLTTLGDAAALQPDSNFSSILRTTFKNAQGRFAGFRNDYYDDEGWWALAWIQAYDVTHQKKYLEMAQSIFKDMTGGWDDTCGGGIWWSKKRHYKNAIANELFLSVAAHLAARSSGKKRLRYLDWAQREWAWFHASGMMNDASLVNDGLTPECKNNGRATWSYNQGVILGGLIELSSASGDTALLKPAQAIAHAAITHLTDADLVLHDPTEPHCSPDTVQFKGIFVRNLSALQKAAPQGEYARFLQANADSIWTRARTQGDEFACRWSGPPALDGAGASSSALDALVAAAALRDER